MEKFLEFAKQSELFKNISEEEIKSILNCISYKIKKFADEQSIFNEGECIFDIGLVIDGCVLVVQEDFWGNRSIVSHISKGQIFGEAFAFSLNKPLSVRVVAEKASEIVFFDFKKIATVCSCACECHNKLIKNLLHMVAEKNFSITKKLQHVSKKTIRDKLLSYLSDASREYGKQSFSIPFNRQQLADYLFVDRSALSNELSKMRTEGIIDFHKNTFKLFSKENSHFNVL